MADLKPIEIVDEATAKTALKQREDRLKAIQSRSKPQPYRYVVTVELPNLPAGAPTGSQFPLATGSQVIKAGTIFRTRAMGVTYSVQGTSNAPLVAANLSFSAIARNAILKSRFKIRDSGSDREWSNDWVPMEFLLTGNENVFRFGNARGVLSGGSNLSVDVDAIVASASIGFLGLSAVAKHTFKFVFMGDEVST